MGTFQIEKWYLDAHSEDGNAFIGYAAKLTWGSISLHYNGYTFSPANTSKIFNSNSFSAAKFPEETNCVIRWNYHDIEGEWTKVDDSFEETLLNDPKGLIEWKVIFPSAKVKVHFRKDAAQEYIGYVEKIRLTIPPWDIPIKELYWGRFLGPNNTLIWIQWRGPVPKVLVYFNGNRQEEALITTELIEFGEYTLDLIGKRTLRKGTILSTVFKRFPAIAAVFPKKIFALSENKWLSDSVLKQKGKIVCHGKAIHEYVVW
jgi:hypothetical protein